MLFGSRPRTLTCRKGVSTVQLCTHHTSNALKLYLHLLERCFIKHFEKVVLKGTESFRLSLPCTEVGWLARLVSYCMLCIATVEEATLMGGVEEVLSSCYYTNTVQLYMPGSALVSAING